MFALKYMRRLIGRGLCVLLAGLAGAAFSNGPRPQQFSFDPATGLSNRLITPNGDGLNDIVVFSFSNPRDSDVSGRIYDLKGGFVADMGAGPAANQSLQWGGKSGGRAVASGVYVYVIEAEGQLLSGTVVVIR